MIPQPHYTLVDTSIGDDPAVVVVNAALRKFEHRDAFPWHLKITVDCRCPGANGMPTAEEVVALDAIEDSIAPLLQKTDNAALLARITARGTRVLLFRVRDPETANDKLQALSSASEQSREWDFWMELDPDWELARPELDLLERDVRFN